MAEIINIDDKQFNVWVLASDQKTMVKFYSPTCVPCKMLDNILKTIDDIDIYTLDVTQYPHIAAKYGIMSVPTTIVFNNGVEVGRKVGFQKKEVLLELI